MLWLRQAQIEQDLAAEAGRLRRVEAHLRALEGSIPMSSLDVAIKTTESVRIAETSGTAPGFGHENLAPLFQELVPNLLGQLSASNARPGIMIAWYEEPADDGSVVLHAGFDIGDQAVQGDAIRVVDLPKTKVASLVHRGPMDEIAEVYEALVSWTENSGYELAGRSRELYHEWNDERPELSVTELQLPIK
jgi:effector-binding domain-containing protein